MKIDLHSRGSRLCWGAIIGVLFSAGASAAETEIGYPQLRDYLARADVHAFVPHLIPFEGSRTYRVTGTRTDDGGCRFSEVLSGQTADLSPTRRFGTIDLATRLSACEKVVQRGYYPIAGGAPGAGNAGTLGVTGGLIPLRASPATTGSTQQSYNVPFPATPLALKLPTSLAASASVITSAGLYSEWNYGNTPALADYGQQLITSSIDNSAQIPSDICQVGGTAGWQTKYTFNPLLGYIIDAGYNNRSEISVYCHSTCSSGTCRYDWGYNENRGFYRVRNPGLLGQGGPSTVVPVCINPITNTYEPNRIRVYTDGRYEATVNTWWAGWALGCGEFLQRSSSVHSP